MTLTVQAKLFIMCLILVLISVVGISTTYFLLTKGEIQRQSRQSIQIAFDIVLNDIYEQLHTYPNRFEEFLDQRDNTLRRAIDTYNRDAERAASPLFITGHLVRVCSELKKFGDIIGINRLSLYSRDNRLLALYENAEGLEQMGAHVISGSGEDAFLSLVDRSEQAQILYGSEPIPDRPVPDGFAPRYQEELPLEASAALFTETGLLGVRIIAPVYYLKEVIGTLTGDVIYSQAMIESYARLSKTEVNLFAGDGLVIGSLPAQQSLPLGARAAMASCQTIHQASERLSLLPIRLEGKDYYQGQCSVDIGEQSSGAITISISQDAEQQAIGRMLSAMLMVSLIAIAAAFAFTVVYSRNTIQTIQDLIISTSNIANGELNQPIDVSGFDEFGTLAKSFDRMRGAVKEQIFSLESEIAERQSIERRLRSSEERYREIVDNAVMGIYQISQEGRIIMANQRMAQILGYDSPRQLMEEVDNIATLMVNPEMRVEIIQQMRQFGHIESAEVCYRRKDGRQVWCSSSARVLTNPDTGEQLHEGFLLDIDQRKQAELALRKSEQNFRVLAEQAPLGIVLIDPTGRYRYMNRKFKATFGYTEEEIKIGRDWFRLAFPDSHRRREAVVTWRKNLETYGMGDPRPQTHEVRCKDGTVKTIRFLPVTLDDQSQLIFNEDITDRKKLEQQLRQAQKMEAIGSLAGGIAHDFNNILASVVGYTELSLQSSPKESPAQRHMQMVLKAAERARDLVNQILMFSRQTEHELIPITLQTIVKEVIKLIRASLPSTIEVRFDLETMATVMADQTQIHQLLMNLCTNAGHAMGEKGGILAVSLKEVELDAPFAASHQLAGPGPFVELAVSDTGDGIDRRHLNRIFDPFFTTKERGKGTGLGLSVVHGIVTVHQGAITVYSEPGEGTTFTVYLPRVADPLEKSPPRIKSLPGGTETILLVDDEYPVVDAARQNLENLGYTVIPCTESVEALNLLQQLPLPYDLLITDMTMPKVSGEQLAREALSVNPDLPIIFTSGYSNRQDEERLLKLGVRSVTRKPILLKDLAPLVRRVLDEVAQG